METVLLVSLLYAGAFMLGLIVISLILAYALYLRKASQPTTY